MDKGYMKGRKSLAVALMIAVAVLAIPAMAQAAPVFTSHQPAKLATVYVAPVTVGVDVLGVDVKTATISVNGNAKTAKANVVAAAAGSWTYSEVADGNGVYHPHWAWTTGSVAARTSLIADPGVFATGTVTLVASGVDKAGVAFGPETWTFTYADNVVAPPVIVPAAANQTCRSANCHGTEFDDDNAMTPGACTDCHTGNFAPHGFEAAEAVSGHNTTLLGKVGAKTSFPGLTWESEIATSSYATPFAPAGSPLIGQALTTGQTGALSTAWNLPTQSVFWPANSTEAPSTAVKGLTWNSVITCEDCHTGLAVAGPQGAAAANYGLDTNYPAPYEYAELTKYVTANLAWPTTNSNYNTPLSVSGIAMFPGAATKSAITSASVAAVPVGANTAMANRTDGTSGATAVICAKCHKLETFISTADGGVALNGGAVEGANTAHDSHHQDQTDGSAQCVNCHIGLPHAWKRPRLLVNTDVDSAPFLSPMAIGTTRATSTGKQNTGVGVAGLPDTRSLTGKSVTFADGTVVSAWGKGFNGQGLQSLSGADSHTLMTTTAGHQGMAAWAEPSCQACGDHPGEDGVRITEE